MSEWVDAALLSDLQAQERIVFDWENNTILLLYLDNKIYAVDNRCTHAEFDLQDSEIENCVITCALHGAKFCLKTGEVLAPPACENLPVYETRIANSTVQVLL